MKRGKIARALGTAPNPQGRGRSVEGSAALNRPSYDITYENTKDPPRKRRRKRNDQWYDDGSTRNL